MNTAFPLKVFPQHQISTTLSRSCEKNRTTPALPCSLCVVLTSTPKPRAEGRWPPVALCRAGLGSRLGRCWVLPTGEQHPSRQPKPKSFCHFQNSQVSLLRCLAFFVSERDVLATRSGCAPRSACRGGLQPCGLRPGPTEPAGETESGLNVIASFASVLIRHHLF